LSTHLNHLDQTSFWYIYKLLLCFFWLCIIV
jgi:hypothetical protein